MGNRQDSLVAGKSRERFMDSFRELLIYMILKDYIGIFEQA